MSNGNLVEKNIIQGDASRYIKPRWLISGKLSTEAFDLREGDPPETYVSHFILTEGSWSEKLKSAHSIISARISKCNAGSIAIIDIEEALDVVNDEAEPFIIFIEKGLPHCGLIYITPDQQKIQEVKATLCFLAGKRMVHAQRIQDAISNDKDVGNISASGYCQIT